MEYSAANSLNQYLGRYGAVISLPIKIYFLYQVSMGLRFLRDVGIVHLDLKPENILMNQFPSAIGRGNLIYLLRLIDFGESYWKVSGISSQITKRGLTVPYASP